MKLKRAAVYSAGLAALAAWWVSAATAVLPSAPVPVRLQEAAVERQGQLLDGEIDRLRERNGLVAEPRQPARDLFRFAAPSSLASAGSALEAPAAVGQPPPEVPLSRSFELIGLARDEGPEGAVRTAIISGEGNLFIVREGEAITPRFRVSRISEEVVELVGPDGAFLRLTLK